MSVFARFPPAALVGEVTVAEQNCSLLSEATYSRGAGASVLQWRNTTYQSLGRSKDLVMFISLRANTKCDV